MDDAVEPPPKPVPWHLPAVAAGVAAMYYAGARLGLALTFEPLPISVLWPPNALLLAALMLSPRRWWLALIAAAFPAHLLGQIESDVPAAMVLFWFVSNITEALIGASLMLRLGGPGPQLRSTGSVLAFVLVAVAGPFLSSFLDAAFVHAIGWGNASYWTLFEVRSVSNMLATLVFVPALVTCVQAREGEFPRLARARVPEATALAAGLLTASLFGFGAAEPSAWTLYLPMPFLAWAALRFGTSLTSTAFAGVTVLVLIGATHGKGPFAQAATEPSVLSIQLFLIAMAVPLLLMAGLVEDRRAAQRGLRSARELFSTAFRAGPDPLAISLKADGRILEANEQWLGLMGSEESERVAPLASHLDADSRRKLQLLAREGRSPRNVEVSLRDRHGHTRVALVSAAPVEVDGQACELTMARDITTQREAETVADEERRQLTHLTRVATLTDFSGTLAHELNQPLAAILSNAQAAIRMLSSDAPDVEEVRVILRDIVDADKRAGVLIHHLRLLMKNSNEEFVQLDVNHLVQDVLELVHGEFLQRKVELKTSFSNGLPQVRGDHVQLQQLILNLVLNACEAMQDSRCRERVLSVSTHHDASGRVQVLISDTGPGIPRELLTRIFSPFFTTKANGLGLGLSICRRIVAAHGGTLTAQSGPGEGASFRLALPTVPGAVQRAPGGDTSTATSS